MGRKLQLLEFVKNKVTFFTVPRFFKLNACDYSISESIRMIENEFNSDTVIVRSSASDEDTISSSSAGEYESILNIPSNSKEKITEAINTVVNSYEKKRPLLPKDKVIIQEMVQGATMSGVIFTHDLNTGAPYYVVNYDDQSGTTDTVTSGNGEYSNRTLYIHRGSINKLRSKRFIKLLQAVQELEQIMESRFLDIEFALGEDLTPYLLQVRAITTQPNWDKSLTKKVDKTLQSVKQFVTDRLNKSFGIYGKTTVLGQMPDWNPIEMIGRAPRTLATSLYQTLITDNAWRSAREIMGYAVPSGQPLMVTLAGQPFIDTRLSFHSYLPKTVSPHIAEKLIDHWVDHLKSAPELHDKVEFDVAITTYSFDFDKKIDRLIGNALTVEEKKSFKQAHLKQTIQLIKGTNKGSCKAALDKINLLNKKQIEANNTPDRQYNLSSLYSMVDECIHLGTIPFSILARHGFIAKTILLSLNQLGIISHDEVNKIQASIHTIASDVVDDMNSLQSGALSHTEFMQRYGHLRPGTYDIMSHRYDQMKNFTSNVVDKNQHKAEQPFKFSQKQQQKINNLLEENGFENFNSDNLLNYIHEATAGREYGKFVFTRSVSDILEMIALFAQRNGLSRNEISHVPLNVLFNISKNSNEHGIAEQLRDVSRYEAEKHSISIAIRLPQLLIDEAGVYIIPFQVSHPNFITHKKVTAPIVILSSKIEDATLSGNIVIIEGADPGFDWIFSQKIVGLITKYGGANSHMAIRCAEFGIPAAIGCGEQRFELLLKSDQVHLDCAAGLLNVVH
jgi:glutamine kinase